MLRTNQETVDEVCAARSNDLWRGARRQGGSLSMLGRLIITLFTAAVGSAAVAADYRGMPAGWPAYANGYYAANYPAGYATGPGYYVARPVAAPGYAARPAGAMYVPVTAAYAPANSYAVAPAGLGSAGSEAAAYYGQPTNLNYVPPRFAYRTNYAPAPVYMYRPVTVYDPITAQPVTCLQASTYNSCQPQRTRCFSLLNPFSWFGRGSSCGSGGGCGSAPAPTTAYCGTAASQCGQQPYYPGQQAIPVVPAPAMSVPLNAIPAFPSGTIIPRAGTTVPPPPTGAGVPRGGFSTPGLDPSSLPPRLPAGTTPGGTFNPGSGSTFTPGNQFTPLPTNPPPGGGGFTPPAGTVPPSSGSFPTNPGSAPPPTGFGTGGFGTGTNYAPAVDPDSSSTTLTPTNNSAQAGGNKPGPSHSVFGSGYGSAPARPDSPRGSNSHVIRAPELGPAMPPSVQTVPDLDAPSKSRPGNHAPPLLEPRDKTAAVRDRRWSVVPAVWPRNQAIPQQLSDHPVVPTKSHQPLRSAAVSESPHATTQPPAMTYDDRGWKSAAN
jgi:hypothetical protein